MFKKLIDIISPPVKWKIPVYMMLSVFMGIAAFVFYLSNAASYLNDEPETCTNCHVMYPYYTSWQHSSHGRVAVCNDCHVPHDNLVRKYLFKANDGMRHATIFTLRMEPEVIHIREAGATVVQENCIRCHRDAVENTSLIEMNGQADSKGKPCWDCHREVPHGSRTSLSSSPFGLIPQKGDNNVPEWLMKSIKNK